MSFEMLGMNVGATHTDYTLLHEKQKISNDDDLSTLVDNYLNAKPEDKKNFEEKMFALLQLDRGFKPPQSEEFANLLFTQGWEILETRIKEKNEDYTNLIDSYPDQFSRVLNDRIKEKEGAKIFEEQYPKLLDHLRSNDKFQLPPVLEKSLWRKILEFIGLSKRIDPVDNPIATQLKKVKDRLAENFFTHVVNSKNKPAVISLQEVQTSNQGILNILSDANYVLVRPFLKPGKPPTSDTVIALDSSHFKDISSYDFKELPDTAVAFAIEKATGEEYLFVSVHIPGFKLELSDSPTANELAYVEAEMETGANEIRNLQNVLESLKYNHPNAHIVIQGDFNVFPEFFNHPKINDQIRSMNLFQNLEKTNLDVYGTGLPTELNRHSETLPERELDYFFSSPSLRGRACIIEQNDVELSLINTDTNHQKAQITVHFDPMLLFSDHRPIWMQINPSKTNSNDDSKK